MATPKPPHHMSRLELESIGRVLNAVEGAGELAHDRALDVARGGRGLLFGTNLKDILDPLKGIENVRDRTLAGLSETTEAKRVSTTLDLARRKAGFAPKFSSALGELSGLLRAKGAQEAASNFGVGNFGVPREVERMLARNPLADQYSRHGSGLDIVSGPDRVVREELLKSGFAAPFEGDENVGFLKSGYAGRLQRKVQKQALYSKVLDDSVSLFALGKDKYAVTNAISNFFNELAIFGPEGPEPTYLGGDRANAYAGQTESLSAQGIKDALDRAKKAKSGPITGVDILKQIKPGKVFIAVPDFLDEGVEAADDITELVYLNRQGQVVDHTEGFMAALDDLAANADRVDDLIEAEKKQFALLKPLHDELEGMKKRFLGKLPGFPLPATKRMGGTDLTPAASLFRFPTQEQKAALAPRRSKYATGFQLSFLDPDTKKINVNNLPFSYAESKTDQIGMARGLDLELPEEVFKDVKQDEVAKVVRAVRDTKDLRLHLLTLDPDDPEILNVKGMRGYLKRHLMAAETDRIPDITGDLRRRENFSRIRRPSTADIFNLVLNDKDFAEFKRDVDARFFRQSRGQNTLYGRLYNEVLHRSSKGIFKADAINVESAARQLVKDIEKIRALKLSPEAVYLGLQASRDTISSPNSALGILRMAGPSFEGKFTALESRFAKAGVEVADEAAKTFRSSLRKLVGPSAAMAQGMLGEDLSREIASTFANASSPKDLAERLQAVRRKILSGQVRAIRATYPEPELQRYHIRNMVNRFADILPDSVPYKPGDIQRFAGVSDHAGMVEMRARMLTSRLAGSSTVPLSPPTLHNRLARLGLREGQGLGLMVEIGDNEFTPLSGTMTADSQIQNEAVIKRLRMLQENKEGAALIREGDIPILAAMQSDVEVGRRQFLGRMVKAAAQATPQTRAALETAGAIQGYVDPAHVGVTREVANSQVLKGMLSFLRKFPGVP